MHVEGAGPRRAALILHPWSKLGGCMEDPTVVTQFRYLQAAASLQSLFGGTVYIPVLLPHCLARAVDGKGSCG